MYQRRGEHLTVVATDKVPGFSFAVSLSYFYKSGFRPKVRIYGLTIVRATSHDTDLQGLTDSQIVMDTFTRYLMEHIDEHREAFEAEIMVAEETFNSDEPEYFVDF